MKIVFDPKAVKDGFNPPARFYFIRHGRTDYNRRRLVQGQTDAALDAAGLAQAEEAAVGLLEHTVTGIALKTARIIADKNGLNLRLLPELMERSYGVWEGRAKDEVGFSSSAEPEGCERLETFRQRVADGLQDALDRDGILIVSHGGVLRVLGDLLGVELPDGARENGTILEFTSQ